MNRILSYKKQNVDLAGICSRSLDSLILLSLLEELTSICSLEFPVLRLGGSGSWNRAITEPGS